MADVSGNTADDGLNGGGRASGIGDDGPAAPEATDGERSRSIRTARLDSLQRAIEKAQTLLYYSATSNVAVEDQVVADITAAQERFGTDDWSPEVENAFWRSLRKLSEATHPVTESTILYSNRRGKSQTTIYFFFGLSLLVVLLLAQIYWVFVNNTSKQIHQWTETLDARTTELQSTELEISVLLNRNAFKLPQPGLAPGDCEDIRLGSGPELALSAADIETLIAKCSSKTALDREITKIGQVLRAQYQTLNFYIPSSNFSDTIDTLEIELEKAYLIAQAASILALASTYVLPLLYGALGTVAYILRTLTRTIRARTLSPAEALNFQVRIPLGMLSGVAIGWFLSTDGLPTGFQSVQPLALAFVAGYSVELIFAAMDRLVAAFTGRQQAGAG